MTEARIAPSTIWGLDAGDRSLSPRDGKLVIGGYDASRFSGNLTTFPLGNWSAQRRCPLQVRVTSLRYVLPYAAAPGYLLGGPAFDSISPQDYGTPESEAMLACVDPFQEHFTFTPSMAKTLSYLIEAGGSPSPSNDLNFSAHNPPKGTLEIVLDNGYKTTIPNDHLFTPERGSNDNGDYVITNSSHIVTGITYNANNDPGTVQPLLGGLYLTFNYLIVDYEHNQFQMAPSVQQPQDSVSSITAVCTPTATSPVPDEPRPSSTSNGKSKAGAIGGGTVGAVVGVAAIAGIIFFLLRKRRQNRHRQDPIDADDTFSPVSMGPDPSPDVQKPVELDLVRHSSPSAQYLGIG